MPKFWRQSRIEGHLAQHLLPRKFPLKLCGWAVTFLDLLLFTTVKGKRTATIAEGQWVELVIQCLHWDKDSISTPGISFAAIPLGKGLTVYYLVFLGGTEVPCLCTHNTAHTWNPIPLFKKRVGPCDGWQCAYKQNKETRLNLQNCAPSKTDYGCWSMRGDLLQKTKKKMIKSWSRKMAIDVKKKKKYPTK